MEIDALSGARLSESPFDLNRDRAFDQKDFASLDPADPNSALVPVSGRKSTQGIIKTPGIVTDDRIEYKFASGSAGVLISPSKMRASSGAVNPGGKSGDAHPPPISS